MENKQQNNRNKYLVFIAAGVFLLLNTIISNSATIIALFLILMGVYSLKYGTQRTGLVLLGVGIFVLISNHFFIILILVLVCLGLFYMRSDPLQGDVNGLIRRTRLIDSHKRDKEPWILRSMSLWSAISETRLDFSFAMPEEKETTLVMQGIIGDIDLFIPEGMAVSVESSLAIGRLHVMKEQELGTMNKVHWQSPDYDEADTRLKLIVSYIVGDIDIRMI